MPRYTRSSRATRLHYRTTGNVVNVRIGSEKVDQSYAVVMYRCKECLGRLRKRDAGLCCIDSPAHLGFIHKLEAAEIVQAQAEELEKIKAVYEIRDGIIEVKEQ